MHEAFVICLQALRQRVLQVRANIIGVLSDWERVNHKSNSQKNVWFNVSMLRQWKRFFFFFWRANFKVQVRWSHLHTRVRPWQPLLLTYSVGTVQCINPDNQRKPFLCWVRKMDFMLYCFSKASLNGTEQLTYLTGNLSQAQSGIKSRPWPLTCGRRGSEMSFLSLQCFQPLKKPLTEKAVDHLTTYGSIK